MLYHINVATDHFGVVIRPPIELEPETQLYRGGAVGFEVGLGRIGIEMVKIIDHQRNQSITVLVVASFCLTIWVPIPDIRYELEDRMKNRGFTIDPERHFFIEMFQSRMVFASEA